MQPACRVVFMSRGRKYGSSLDTGDRDTAKALPGGVEKALLQVGQKLLTFPEGVDVVEFVKHGGRLPGKEAPPPPAPLDWVFDGDSLLPPEKWPRFPK